MSSKHVSTRGRQEITKGWNELSLTTAMIPDLWEYPCALGRSEDRIIGPGLLFGPSSIEGIQLFPTMLLMSLGSEAEVENISAMHDGEIRPGIVIGLGK